MQRVFVWNRAFFRAGRERRFRVLAPILLLLSGCSGASGPGIRQGSVVPGFEAAAHRVAADPLGYIRKTADRAAALKQYKLTFFRQERLGIVPSLHEMEHIAARFRDEPFSVYFKWQDANSEFAQAAYVQGTHADKVLLLPRQGLFGLPPTVQQYGVQDAVTFHKSRNPITDFGLARMMERTLRRMADADRFGGVKLSYRGVETVGRNLRPAHRFEVLFPKQDPYPNKRMDLYVDARTDLPAGVYLWLPDGKLDAMYLYEDVDPAVALEAADFAIKLPKHGKKRAERSASTQ